MTANRATKSDDIDIQILVVVKRIVYRYSCLMATLAPSTRLTNVSQQSHSHLSFSQAAEHIGTVQPDDSRRNNLVIYTYLDCNKDGDQTN